MLLNSMDNALLEVRAPHCQDVIGLEENELASMDSALLPATAAYTPFHPAVQEPELSISTPGTYTLLAVDPDAPSPHSPKHRSWLHWMVRRWCP